MILLGSRGSMEHSIRYPAGRKVLNPEMSKGCPLNNVDTRSMTPGVSILLYNVLVGVYVCVSIHASQDKTLRLTFKIFHDIQELIVYVRPVRELSFNFVEVS